MADSEKGLPPDRKTTGRSDPEENRKRPGQFPQEDSLRAYLLGDLFVEDHLRMEQLIFSDENAFESLEAVEDELIEAYSDNTLSSEDARKLEKGFIWTPERQQKLQFTEAMKRYSAKKEGNIGFLHDFFARWKSFWCFQNPALSWTVAASLFVLIAGGIWSVNEINRLESALKQADTGTISEQMAELQTQNSVLSADLTEEQSRRILLEQKVEELQENSTPNAVRLLSGQSRTILTAIALTPSLMRGTDSDAPSNTESNPKYSIPLSSDFVKFELADAPEGYSRYSANIRTVGGSEVLNQTFPSPQRTDPQQPLQMTVSADILKYEDYVLSLGGIGPDGNIENVVEYPFRIR